MMCISNAAAAQSSSCLPNKLLSSLTLQDTLLHCAPAFATKETAFPVHCTAVMGLTGQAPVQPVRHTTNYYKALQRHITLLIRDVQSLEERLRLEHCARLNQQMAEKWIQWERFGSWKERAGSSGVVTGRVCLCWALYPLWTHRVGQSIGCNGNSFTL